MLTIRRRKGGKIWHIRGTIRVGRETRVVKEHSCGTDRRDDAEAYRSKFEADIRHEILHGRDGRTQSLTIADAGLCYIERPGGVKSYDVWRIGQINYVVGDRPIARAGEAWSEFVRVRCAGLSAATTQRYRSTYSAAINYLAEQEGFDVPKLPRGERVKGKPIRYLAATQADRLIESYAPHVQPIAITLRWQGLRIGEALRLDWVHINWATNSIFVAESKTGVSRSVSMHKRTRAALHRLWADRGSPKEGMVFLYPFYLPKAVSPSFDWQDVDWAASSIRLQDGGTIRISRRSRRQLETFWALRGSPAADCVPIEDLALPYADPRSYKFPSGSPIKKAHASACRRAGTAHFTVHDWRHHWACQCVMAGIDLETIKQEGGWKSLRMVERYATVSAAHRVRAMAKLK